MVHYHVKLTKSEVEELQRIINKGSHTSQTFRTAYILLNCDEGEYSEKVTNEQMSKVLKVGMRTIDRVKKRFIEEGLEACLERKPTSRARAKNERLNPARRKSPKLNSLPSRRPNHPTKTCTTPRLRKKESRA